MQWPHPSFGDAFLFLVLVWLMRWHVAVVQSWSQRSQRSWSEHPPAVDFIAHSPTRARLSSSLFRTCLFLRTPSPSVAVCRTDPHRHPSLPFSESGGRCFSCPAFLAHTFSFYECVINNVVILFLFGYSQCHPNTVV